MAFFMLLTQKITKSERLQQMVLSLLLLEAVIYHQDLQMEMVQQLLFMNLGV